MVAQVDFPSPTHGQEHQNFLQGCSDLQNLLTTVLFRAHQKNRERLTAGYAREQAADVDQKASRKVARFQVQH